MSSIQYCFPTIRYLQFQWRFRHFATVESFKVIPVNADVFTEELKDNFLTYIAGGEL